MKFRALKAKEIEVRIGTIGEKGVTLLLYKDARCDQNILDETVGEMNWQRDHKEVKGNLYAGVGIYDNEKKQWVWKWDCGTESYTEKEKGEASDSFKRACFNWGIGRELYTAPFMFIKADTIRGERGFTLKDKNAFYGCEVSDIGYFETDTKREISFVKIINKSGDVIFSWNKSNQRSGEKKTAEQINEDLQNPDGKITAGAASYLEGLVIDTKSNIHELFKYYNVDGFEDLTNKQFEHCKNILEKRLKEQR